MESRKLAIYKQLLDRLVGQETKAAPIAANSAASNALGRRLEVLRAMLERLSTTVVK